MAYKNKKKNKKHIADLQNIGWRKTNAKRAAIKKGENRLRDFGISEQKRIESIMRLQGLI